MMVINPTVPELVQKKLDVFARLESEFEESFQFVAEVHGQKRLEKFFVADIVRYLHALWICECKADLLSVYKTVKEYEGRLCLALLRRWQEDGDSPAVVDFLQHKLDGLPFAEIARQVYEARRDRVQEAMARRLEHGQRILLNRGFNLMYALEAIIGISEDELIKQVHEACQKYGHTVEQIERQLAEMEQPLYTYVPHQLLAQQNMQVMNRLGVSVIEKPEDLPGQRSWRVVEPTEPLSPFAEHVVSGYVELTAPLHNNVLRQRFVDRIECGDQGKKV